MHVLLVLPMAGLAGRLRAVPGSIVPGTATCGAGIPTPQDPASAASSHHRCAM